MLPTKVVTLTLMSIGAWSACDSPKHEEPLVIDERVLAVSVDVGSGDIDLVGADVTSVNAIAKIEGDSNHLGYTLINGRLSLYEECNEDPCGVNIQALIPQDVPIEVYTGSGDVRVQSALDRVHLEAGSGDVIGIDVAGPDLDVQTGSGDIDLRVFQRAERVSVRAGSGDVRLAVPAGAYRLAVDTGSGDESVQGVTDDAAASGSIAIDTGSGDVRIRGR